jgi:hypothetical protein
MSAYKTTGERFTKGKRHITWLMMAVLVSWAGGSLATDAVPDLTGTWTAIAQVVGFGQLTWRSPTTKPTFYPIKINLRIQRQKGQVFYGIKFNKRAREPIVGAIRSDNTVYIADANGYDTGALLARNKLELVYVEAGQRKRVADYAVFKRIR